MLTRPVGALQGRTRLRTIADVSIMDLGSVALWMAKTHYTNAGIKENKKLSNNLPSAVIAKEIGYCG